MANTIEFILKLKDMMSGGMQRASTTAQNALNGVGRSVDTVQRKMSTTGRSVNAMNRRLDDLRKTRDLSINTRTIRDANREIQRLENRIDKVQNLGRGRRGGSMSLAAGLGGFGLAALMSTGIGYSANAGLQGGAQQTSFEVMAGAEKGKKLYQDLTKFAQDSIFGNELYKDSQTMLAFGVSVDKVLPRLRMLGDISMGDKQKLNSLTLAYAQNQAAGRLMGQDLLQMINAGFNPLMEISEMTGISMANLKEKMEKGAISSDMVTAAFQHATSQGGKFFNMTERIANTPFGKWEALKGQIQGVALQFGTALAPAIGDFITNYGVPFITWTGQAVAYLAENWYWIKHVAMVLVTLRLGFLAYTTAVRLATWANTAFNMTMNATPIGRVIAGITALISVLGLLSATTASAMGDYEDTVKESATAMISSPEIEEAYFEAGAKHGKTYAQAVSEHLKNVAADQLKKNVADVVTEMGKGMNTAQALATFLNNQATAKLTLDAGLRIPTNQEKAEFLKDQLPAALKQAGLGGGKEAFNTVAQQARMQVEQLKKYGVDVSSTVEGIISKSYNNLVKMAESGKVPLSGSGGSSSGAGINPSDLNKLNESDKKSSRSTPKVINITFNSPLVQGNTVNVDTKEDADKYFDEKSAEAFLRILQSQGLADDN